MKPIESSTRYRGGALAIGGVLALGGAVMMAGWLFEVSAIVRVLPGFLMVFNTALGFALAGVALASSVLGPQPRNAVRTGVGLVLAALGALVLAQHVFGARLGIDWPALHTWIIDPGRNPAPGRMSPATSIGFVLSGAAFLLAPRVQGTARVLALRALTAAIGTLGFVALAGYILNLPEILDAYWLAQVSFPTAFCFIVLALGLWLDWRGEPWNTYQWIRNEDDRIAISGAIVLAVCILATGIAVFWLMVSQMERTLRTELAFDLKDRRALVVGAIERAVRETADVGERPNVRRLYAAPSDNPNDADSYAFLKTVAASTLKSGFAGFAFFDADGRELGRAGEFLTASDLHIPLPQASHARSAELLWDGGFVLQVRSDVVHEGVRLGEVRGRHRLAELRGITTDFADAGGTTEFALCMQRAGLLHCAPTRFQPKVFELRPVAGSERLPMSYAIEGGTGVLKSTDYRGKRVLAAYAPLNAHGMGLVLKTDLSELYAPIRERFEPFLLILLLASVAGGWTLRWRVRPLARRLARSEVRLRLALENSKLAVWDWDIASGRVTLSEQWAVLLGGVPSVTDTSANELFDLVHPDDAAAIAEQVSSMLKGTTSHYSTEHRVRTPAGGWKWIRSRGRVVERARDGRALRALGTNVDIDERKGYELQLAHRAAHDVLTGLPNRAMFHERLDRAMMRTRRSGEPMAVMYLDVDKFKQVNDTQGHAAGDLLLKEFARRLTACVRTTDTVARFGGDEFAVILEGLRGRDNGLQVAGNIVEAMRAPFVLESATASVSTSVGIAFDDGTEQTTAADLLEAADGALYEAKRAGKDRFALAA